MISTRYLALPLFSLITALFMFSCNKPDAVQGGEEIRGGTFTLIDQDRNSFSVSDLKNRYGLLYFGYTTCPDACPFTLTKIKKVQKILGEEKTRENIQVIFITVDPERDPPEKLRDYLNYFDVGAIGLWGEEEKIRQVADQYNIFYQKVNDGSAAGYLMDHTTSTYLIDSKGKVIHKFRHKDTPAHIASVLKLLLPVF